MCTTVVSRKSNATVHVHVPLNYALDAQPCSKNHNGAGTPTQNGNGTTTPEPLDSVTFRQHSRAVYNSNRMSYMEAVSYNYCLCRERSTNYNYINVHAGTQLPTY